MKYNFKNNLILKIEKINKKKLSCQQDKIKKKYKKIK
jgi:hypothetical protein